MGLDRYKVLAQKCLSSAFHTVPGAAIPANALKKIYPYAFDFVVKLKSEGVVVFVSGGKILEIYKKLVFNFFIKVSSLS